MKKLAIVGLMIFGLKYDCWANSKVSDFTTDAAPATTDVLYEIKNPGGTPLSRKVTIGSIIDLTTTHTNNGADELVRLDSSSAIPPVSISKAYGTQNDRNGGQYVGNIYFYTVIYATDVVAHIDILTAESSKIYPLVKKGVYMVAIDDGWADPARDGNGEQQWRQTTNGGMTVKSLADYAHSKGLKFGIYTQTDEQMNTGGAGSLGYEEVDARSYIKWGVDYAKIDGNDPSWHNESYLKMVSVLHSSNVWVQTNTSVYDYDLQVMNTGNSWRANMRFGDFTNLTKVNQAMDWYAPLFRFVHPGHTITMGGGFSLYPVGATDYKRVVDAYTAMMHAQDCVSAEYGLDIAANDSIWTNEDWYAIWSDPAVIGPTLISSTTAHRIWTVPLVDGSFGVALQNMTVSPVDVSIRAVDLGFVPGSSLKIKSIINGSNTVVRDTYTATVDSDDIVFVRAWKEANNYVKVHATADQSITGANQVISFDTVDYDTDQMFLGTTNGFRVPKTGRYLVHTRYVITSVTGVGALETRIFAPSSLSENVGTIVATKLAAGDTEVGIDATQILWLTANEVIKPIASPVTITAATIYGGSASAGAYRPFTEIYYLGF